MSLEQATIDTIKYKLDGGIKIESGKGITQQIAKAAGIPMIRGSRGEYVQDSDTRKFLIELAKTISTTSGALDPQRKSSKKYGFDAAHIVQIGDTIKLKDVTVDEIAATFKQKGAKNPAASAPAASPKPAASAPAASPKPAASAPAASPEVPSSNETYLLRKGFKKIQGDGGELVEYRSKDEDLSIFLTPKGTYKDYSRSLTRVFGSWGFSPDENEIIVHLTTLKPLSHSIITQVNGTIKTMEGRLPQSGLRSISKNGDILIGSNLDKIEYALIKQSDGEYFLWDKPDGTGYRNVFRLNSNKVPIGFVRVNDKNESISPTGAPISSITYRPPIDVTGAQ